MTIIIASLQELEALLDTSLPPSPWLSIEQERVAAFADATGDHQWIHVDVPRAEASPFGGTIAHGYLTLSLIPGLASQIYQLEAGTARLNYGTNKVRFPAPVLVGARVRLNAKFTGLERRERSALLTTEFVVEIDGATKPACIAETLTLLVS